MKTTKRIVLAAIGVPLLLVTAACGGKSADGYDAGSASPSSADTADAAQLALEAPQPSSEPIQSTVQEPAAGIVVDKLVATTIPKMGQVVTDAKGWVLYRFDKDSAKPPTSVCVDKCAAVWPPMLANGMPTVEGISADLVGTVARADGTTQLTLGGWPLYRYTGDPQPGAWKGQMVNGTWFVIAPDGKKNLTCLPTATPTAVAPPAAPAPPAGGATEQTPPGGGYGY